MPIKYQHIPIYNAVKRYSSLNPVPFHMPGHKLGRGIPERFLKDMILMDVTEIPGTDNLHFPEGPIKEAQKLASKAFEADETFFVVNGSTGGIHAMILSICRPGDKLVVSRDCHRSVINGMALAGVKPVYVKPQFDSGFGISTDITPSKIEQALDENPEAVGVLITRPNYYGICSDMGEIARVTHRRGKVLAVDEAHGAHLVFSERLPPSAMMSGADICVQSAHKTLPALTQGAYVHVKNRRVDIDRLKVNLSMLQTTSPSYILMAFLDIARAVMEESGRDLLEKLLENVEGFKKAVSNCGNLSILSQESLKSGRLDCTRVVINVRDTGKTGFQIDGILREEFNIQVEMADFYNIVCIATVADREEDFERLAFALNKIAYRFKADKPLADIFNRSLNIPPQTIELKDVLYSRKAGVKLDEAVGKVSGSMIVPYPPGIPVICPGEIILGEAVEYIYNIVGAGGIVNGLGKDMEIQIMEGC
ncbi:MAG: aminotransferase class I/II-fold pyridoxal phosphate-dependent enzyme [Clostridia bacterium]|nr:aminotransferase class I/II-fold pyridoxal phosphate-dependent enzyme [Clostridia bacterium]